MKTNPIRFPRSALFAALLTTTLLTACGGGDDTAPAPAGAAPVAPVSPAPVSQAPVGPAQPPVVTTPADASTGILGTVMATVFAGDYTLNCRPEANFFITPSAAFDTSFALKIKTDGTMTLNGVAFINPTTPGEVELQYGNPTVLPATLTLLQRGSNGGFVTLLVAPDGTLATGSIHSAGKYYSCPGAYRPQLPNLPALTQSVPASFVNLINASTNGSIFQKIARTETVAGCVLDTRSTPAGNQSLVLGADGSASINGRSFTGNQLFDVIDKTFATDLLIDTQRLSSVSWSPSARAQPGAIDLSILLFNFNGTYKTKNVVLTKPDSSFSVLCNL